MLFVLKGELIKKGEDPVKAIMKAIDCSEKTARNKLNGVSDFTVPESMRIQKMFFEKEDFDINMFFKKIDSA